MTANMIHKIDFYTLQISSTIYFHILYLHGVKSNVIH